VKHAPKWEHLGDGHYEFEVPGLLKVDKERINYSLAEKHGSRAKIKD